MTGEDLGVGDHGGTRASHLHGLQHAGRGGRFAEVDGQLRQLAVVGIVPGRQASGALLAQAGGGGVIRATVAGEGDLEDAETILLDADILARGGGLGRGDDGGEVFLAAAAREGERGVEGEVGVARGLHAVAPAGDRLVLDGDAGGEADPAVGVTHERPGLV